MAFPEIRCYFGKRGSGKSTLARYQLAAFKRYILFDPNCERDNAGVGRVVTTRAELVDALLAAKGRRPVRLVWRGMLNGDPGEEYDFGARAAWSAGNLAVLWDELDMFGVSRDRRYLRPFCRQVVELGRHRGLDVLACSRRPAEVPRSVTANADRIMVFHTHEPKDLTYLRAFMGPTVDQLPTLQQADHECIDWTPKAVERRASPFS